MTLITYQRQIVAIAGVDRFYWPGDRRAPRRRRAEDVRVLLALYARDVHTGTLPGDPYRYLPWRGECYARAALMPTREFRSLQHRFDHDLAEHFQVPSSRSPADARN